MEKAAEEEKSGRGEGGGGNAGTRRARGERGRKC
jgi:hypothetical protein